MPRPRPSCRIPIFRSGRTETAMVQVGLEPTVEEIRAVLFRLGERRSDRGACPEGSDDRLARAQRWNQGRRGQHPRRSSRKRHVEDTG